MFKSLPKRGRCTTLHTLMSAYFAAGETLASENSLAVTDAALLNNLRKKVANKSNYTTF